MKAILMLEDGTRFEGRACGAQGTAVGAITVNSSITGYQELVCHQDNENKIVLMTYPIIGNVGVIEPKNKPVVSGLIVREMCKMPSNWKVDGLFSDFLEEHNVVAIEGIDTRHLTALLRGKENVRAVITTNTEADLKMIMEGR